MPFPRIFRTVKMMRRYSRPRHFHRRLRDVGRRGGTKASGFTTIPSPPGFGHLFPTKTGCFRLALLIREIDLPGNGVASNSRSRRADCRDGLHVPVT